MRLDRAIKIAERVKDNLSDRETSGIEALFTLIQLAKKVQTRPPRCTPGLTVCEMVRSLLKAKNPKAILNITDTEGSFSDAVFTVDEASDGEEVNIVVKYVKL